jgi:hypothetical protein
MPATFDTRTNNGLRCTAHAGIIGITSRLQQEIIGMKTVLYHGSRQVRVDTARDPCLYAAPRPVKKPDGVQRWGKDLYVHTDEKKNATYYFRLWSVNGRAEGRIVPVSPVMAERFLRGHGLICDLFPKSDPVTTLYQWGYGIAEEF